MSSESPDVVLYDVNGNPLAVQNATAIPANTSAILAAGSDGTNSRYFSVNSSGQLVVVGAGVSGTPSGGVITIQGVSGGTNVPVSQGTSPWTDNITQFGSTNISTGTGASGAGIPRVTVSNDSNILATQSGTWTVQQGTPPWVGSDAQTTETTASWTTSTAVNTNLALTITNYSSVTVTLNQTTTITGGNVTFEVSDTSAGTNWYSISMAATSGANFIPITTYTLAASTNTSFQGNVSAYVQFRVRLSTAISGTGTVNVGIAASSAAATFQHAAYITDASHGPVAVKGASTAAATTDPALVVAVSPNNTVAVTQSTSPWVDNISQFGGNNVVTGTGASGVGIPRVTVSNDSNILATQSGTWTVNQGTPNTAANAWSTTITDGVQTANVSTVLGLQVDSATATGTTFSEYPVITGAVDQLGNAQNLTVQAINGFNQLLVNDPICISKLDTIILLLTDIKGLLAAQLDAHPQNLITGL